MTLLRLLYPHLLFASLAAGFFLTGCQGGTPPLPTLVAAAPTLAATDTAAPAAAISVPPTWTPVHRDTPEETPIAPLAAGPPRPTATPLPPLPTRTPRPEPTETAAPQPTDTLPPAAPIPGATPILAGPNLLPNPSFEGGWYHPQNISELQVPNGWTFTWVEGDNHLDPDPWNRFVRPESRVLHRSFLPAHEHPLFIWSGDHTLKVFKEYGAIQFQLTSQVTLSPGRYQLTIHVFPDLVDEYLDDGGKVWAPDPLSGEVRLIVDSGGTGWALPAFGRKNSFTYTFDVTESRPVEIGAAFRGRWAITNNGWFMDDWSLQRVAN